MSITTPILADIPNYHLLSPPEFAKAQSEYIVGVGFLVAGLFAIYVGDLGTASTLGATGAAMLLDSVPKLYYNKLGKIEMEKTLGQIKSASQLP